MPDPDFSGALVLTGGGTGGHFFPALALAEGARARWPGRPVHFVGARRGIEAGKLPDSGWPHLLLDVEGFVGRSPLRALKALARLWRATRRMRRLFRNGRPWAVVGTGGYAAAPALLAARSLGIPYFLHESSAARGALVKLVAARARCVWCGMAEAGEHLPKASCKVVGTAVRAAFLRGFVPLEDLRTPFRLLVMGGSGGARALNEAVIGMAGALLEAHPDWEILHQTGRGAEGAAPGHARHTLVPFIDDVAGALEASTLVLCRAGAVTCAELRACGRPAVLVPLPTSAGDHQRLNARAMAGAGRAEVVEQGEGFETRLQTAAGALMEDPARRSGMGRSEANDAVQRCLDDLAGLEA